MAYATYVFSEEIYLKECGKPKGKGIWAFGDRNKTFLITVGSMDKPVTYQEAKKETSSLLAERRYPIYKTIYLHPLEAADQKESEE